MYSKYFEIDIDIPEQTMFSAGEEVRIIPHAVLEDILYNSEIAISKNVIIHYTPIATNEARHYACLCAISDNCGRRTESVGEALDATLDTDIARNYPVLMAYKRAFDDAAIKYLGLEGKVYSDQQIARSEDETKLNGITAPDFTQDDFDVEDTKSVPDATPEPSSITNTSNKFETETTDEFSGVQQNSDKFTSSSFRKKKHFGRSASSDTPSETPMPAKPNTRGKPLRGRMTAPSISTEEFGNDSSRDEFDVLLECSRLKEPCTIREAYAKNPDIVHWCATQMRVYSQVDETNKALCQRYIELMEGTEQ